MSTPNYQAAQNNYDPRWFIWTIVFLVVTGISLVSYIVLSDTSAADASAPLVKLNPAVHKTPATQHK